MDKTIKKLIAKAGNGPTEISPQIATYILNNAPFENQRRISSRRFQPNLEAMKDGTFNEMHDITFALCDDTYYLINGYHRLSAIIMYEKPVMLGIVCKEMPSYNKVKEFYATFENRSIGDMIEAYGRVKVGVKGRDHFIAASKILLARFSYSVANQRYGMSNERIKTDIFSNLDIFCNYFEMIKENANTVDIRSKLQSSFHIALAYITKDAPNWEDFWKGMAGDDALPQKDPRKTYLECIKLERSPYKPGDRIILHNKFARAWNAFLQGTDLSRFHTIPTDQLIPINSTIYNAFEEYPYNMKGER